MFTNNTCILLPNPGMQIIQYLPQKLPAARGINRKPPQTLSSLSIEKLTLLDMEDICRICLSNSALLNIFPRKGTAFETGPSLVQKIMECVQYEIQENDNLPQQICIKCILNAESAFQFKRTCEQTQLVLGSKNMKKESFILEKTVKLETNLEPEKLQKKESEVEVKQITKDHKIPTVTMENKENLKIINTSNNEIPVKSQRYGLRERKVKSICSTKPTKKAISKAPTNRVIQATLYRQRLRGQHSLNHRFKCPHCTAKFDRKSNLQCHLEFHTNPQLKEMENIMKKQKQRQRMSRKKRSLK